LDALLGDRRSTRNKKVSANMARVDAVSAGGARRARRVPVGP